jgi:hypothetical protein
MDRTPLLDVGFPQSRLRSWMSAIMKTRSAAIEPDDIFDAGIVEAEIRMREEAIARRNKR